MGEVLTLCQSLSRFSLPYISALEVTFGRLLRGSSKHKAGEGRFPNPGGKNIAQEQINWLGKKGNIRHVKVLLLVAGETLPIFFIGVFCCCLAALVSSCLLSSQLHFWALCAPLSQPAPVWLLDPKEGIAFGSSITQQIFAVLHHRWGGRLEGRAQHTESCESCSLVHLKHPRVLLSFSSL